MPVNPGKSKAIDFLVDRTDLRHSTFLPAAEPDIAAGQVLLQVASFAFTANNVTYAVAGDMMSYWKFFPAAPGWGRVPVWGFGDVLTSRHAELPAGERVFGYFPMSTSLVAAPTRVTRASFVD